LRIFAKLESMVGAGKARFEVAQHGVDPPEPRQIPGLAAPGDDHRMRAPRIGYPVETREAIGQDLTFRIQSTVLPAFHGRTGASFNGGESRVDRMRLRIDRDGSDKGHFVLGAPSRLAAGAFSAQIGLIGLYGTLQRVEYFAFQHGLHELVMDAPGRGVADTELALQRQCGQPGFRLADQVNRQKPARQGQAGPLKKGSGNQRSLVATMTALKRLARAAFQNGMPGTTALTQWKPSGR